MNPVTVRLTLATAAMALACAPLLAAPADVVHTRISGLRELGAAFKNVNDGLRGDVQTVLIQQSAREIRNASRAQYGWFPAGSGPQAGIKTAAKPEIWARAPQFKAAQDAFARQAEVFERTAAGGNAEAMRVEARKLGGTCKGCHETFRVPKE
jgi:cytochrome c556